MTHLITLPSFAIAEIANELEAVYERCAEDLTLSANYRTAMRRYLAVSTWAEPLLGEFIAGQGDCSPRTRQTYANQVRGVYKRVMEHRYFTPGIVAVMLPNATPQLSAMDLARLHIDYVNSSLKGVKIGVAAVADGDSRDKIWLTEDELAALIDAPLKVDQLRATALRDSLMIYIAGCFGLRAAEVIGLVYGDLLAKYGDAPAILVRHGKGDKQRMIPMSQDRHNDLMRRVGDYLREVGRDADTLPLFSKIYQNGRVSAKPFDDGAFYKYVLGRYSIARGGVAVSPDPHDLRRTFAQLCFEGGMHETDLQRNLGHSALSTTIGYLKPNTAGRIVK